MKKIIRWEKHWSARYIYNRINEIVYQYMYPDHPWLTKTANLILASYLNKSDVGLEFGSGRSTVWFAQRVGFLTSIEHDTSWYALVSKQLKKQQITNVKHCLIETRELEGSQTQKQAYVEVINEFEPESLTFVLVDGVYRDQCAYNVIDKVSPGGIIVIDNVNRYLPSASRSPNSRTVGEGWDKRWGQFAQETMEWRCIWTTSGVTDTALFFKPCRSKSTN
jgi:hypothetical protein